MTRFRELAVIWCDTREAGGTRYVIGRLTLDQTSREFCFRYCDEVAVARARGFTPLPEFPDETASYRSRYLFSTFAQRIPAPNRPDRDRLLAKWGVTQPDDQMEILARGGGLSATDRLELVEWRENDDPFDEPLEIRVAGSRYHGDADTHVALGDELLVRRQPDNAFDPNAVELLIAASGARLGYVPRPLAPFVAGALDRGARLAAKVARRQAPDGDRWVVEVRRVA